MDEGEIYYDDRDQDQNDNEGDNKMGLNDQNGEDLDI
jgi:hypothetical protein